MNVDIVSEDAIIGRSLDDIEKYGQKGTAYIGKVVMSSGERPVLGRRILCDVARPHVVLICGKRGGGKSYTMAVFIEEFARLPLELKKRISVIVIDTVGIFWSLKIPNKLNVSDIEKWGLRAEETRVRVLVPKGKKDFLIKKGVPVDDAFTIKVSDLDETEWLALFRLSWKDPEGVLLSRSIEKVKETLGTYYGIEDIIKAVRTDEEADKITKHAVINRLKVAQSWGLLEKEGTPIKEIAKAGEVTIIDISTYRTTVGMESTGEMIVGLLGKKLFEERMLYRKEEETKLIQGKERESEMPIVWLFVDEAHMFMPNDRPSIALEVLLEWIRIGRQPGLSLVLATQRTEKLHSDAISQCDIFISHRMTARSDIAAVAQLRPSYMHQDFDKYYEEMPKAKGFALILDDNSEKIWLVKIRPRLSWDAGVTANAFRK
ncbi:MAG: ATP-binding protein [Candidatus Diapherotrites archaeon]|nr:ATP-binding protein [Candidatus Diapherotrites archaeon]